MSLILTLDNEFDTNFGQFEFDTYFGQFEFDTYFGQFEFDTYFGKSLILASRMSRQSKKVPFDKLNIVKKWDCFGIMLQKGT
jgi:hypothetical protein